MTRLSVLLGQLGIDAAHNERAVSTLIGFILLFGILIVAWSSWQGAVIPQQNELAEFQHSQKVQGELTSLHESIRRTATTGVSQSVTITLGAEYAKRALGVNFAITGGRIKTVEPTSEGPNNIRFENVEAARSETRDYWNGSLTFPTKDIAYKPIYTRYNNPPETIYSSTALFNKEGGTNVSLADQILVQDRKITIITINGSFSKAKSGEGVTASVETEALSKAENSIAIRNNESGPFTISIPTSVADTDAWNASSLEEQDTVKRVIRDGQNVTITLKNKTYNLRMAKVGLGSGTEDPTAKYITDVNAPSGTLSENSSNEITLEVRDEYNNPLSGFQVNATLETGDGTLTVDEEGESESGTGAIVDTNSTADGRVTFNYTAPDVSSRTDIDLNFTIHSGKPVDREQVWVNTSVLANGGNDGGDGRDSGSETEFAFVSMIHGPPANISGGSRHFITVEIRNETHVLNGTAVTASANHIGGSKDGEFSNQGTSINKPTTGGRITFNYTAATNLGADDRVELQFAISSTQAPRTRDLTVDITGGGSPRGAGGGGGGQGQVNPNASGVVLLTGSETLGKDPMEVNVSFRNTGDTRRNITDVRVGFYFAGGGGNSNNKATEVSAIINRSNPTNPDFIEPGTYGIPTGFISVNKFNGTLAPKNSGSADELTIEVEFGDGTSNSQHFFVMGFQFENGATAEYFVAVPTP